LNILVQKYGGSSLSSPDKIKIIAKKIALKFKDYDKMIIVVSAMGKTTDELTKLAKEISNSKNPREMDMLLTTGEQITASLMSIALSDLGIKSKSINAHHAGIITNKSYTKAIIQKFNKNKIEKHLKDNDILVLTGFQGVTDDGDYTTLGRGGSDTSAVAVAAIFDTECEIYSDFAGIYTVDPKIYPDAKKISVISYDEMLEMSKLGANVLHSRAVELAKKYKTKIYCGASFSDEKGSVIMDVGFESPVVTGLSLDDNQIQVNVLNLPNNHKFVNDIFESASKYNINIDMISIIYHEESIDMSFSVVDENIEEVKNYIEKYTSEHERIIVEYKDNLTKLSIVGLGMKKEKGVAYRFFSRLNSIPIKLVTTSEIKISCLIEEKYKEKAVKELTEEFEL
jgi:aspartate kinase